MEEVMELKVKKPAEEEPEPIEETQESTEEVPDIAEENLDQQQFYDEFNARPYIKIATARLLGPDGTTIYRFDITHKDVDENNGVIELINIVSNFDAIRPENEKGYKNFFTLAGIITFNFPTTIMSYNQNILATITQIESLVNQHLHISGFKESEYRFRIETVVED